MSKKHGNEISPTTDSEKAAAQSPETPRKPARGAGILKTMKNAKDFVVDKASHPEETAGEVKAWAERSAQRVDTALESARDVLTSVSESIDQAREWTADKATQADRILAEAQGVVAKLDDSVHSVQGSATRAVEALREEPASASAAPADPDEAVSSDSDDIIDSEDAPDGRSGGGVPRS